MTPFQQFQVWFGRAGAAQRALTGVAALIALSLVSWLVVPADRDQASSEGFALGSSLNEEAAPPLDGGTGAVAPQGADGAPAPATAPEAGPAAAGSGAAAGGDAGAGPGAGTAGNAVPGPASDAAPRDAGAAAPAGGGAGSVAAPRPGGSAAPGVAQPAGRRCPPGTDQGATASEIKVAITIVNVGGSLGNGTIGVPSPETQEDYWRTAIAAMNGEGGFGCRKLVPTFYDVNGANAAEAQQRCLQIARSRPFLALDVTLAAVGASDCIPNQKVPMIARYLSGAQLKKYYPYYISPTGLLDDVLRNGILAHAQQGRFSASGGFRKLGLLYRTCVPDPIRIARAALAEAGVPKDKVLEYSLGCPPGQQNTAADMQQAVLSFKNAGVTHVTTVAMQDVANFSRAAAQQQFTPRYALADDTIGGTVGTGGTSQPDPANFDGAVNVVSGRYAEETTKGFKPTAATARCDAIYTAKGRPRVYQQKVGFGGSICSLLFMTKALLDRTPQMERRSLVRGIHSIGTLDLSFPYGPIDFAATPPGSPYGRAFWRAIRYTSSCRCSQVVDPTFRPSFR